MKSSTAPSGTISPAAFANRFARPRIVTKPSPSRSTMSPVSRQPPWGGSSTPGFFCPQIAKHDVRSAHEKASSVGNPLDRIDPIIDTRQHASDGPRRNAWVCLPQAQVPFRLLHVAFEDPDAEFLKTDAARLGLHTLRARKHVAHGIESRSCRPHAHSPRGMCPVPNRIVALIP